MTDFLSKPERSKLMGKIRAKNTKPEIIVRKFLFASGLRYRLHQKELPGNPDIVLKKHGIVIFIHGCFWHGHEKCKIYKVPSSNTNFWITKIKTNQDRDAKSIKLLKRLGWQVIIIRECQLLPRKKENTLRKLVEKFRN